MESVFSPGPQTQVLSPPNSVIISKQAELSWHRLQGEEVQITSSFLSFKENVTIFTAETPLSLPAPCLSSSRPRTPQSLAFCVGRRPLKDAHTTGALSRPPGLRTGLISSPLGLP